MGKKKAKGKSKVQVKKERVSKAVEPRLFVGKTRTFRFRNPEGHADKYMHITLKDGNTVPPEVLPILEKDDKVNELNKRVKALEDDLADDGKRNFSIDESKASPGRKSKSKKGSKK